MSPDSIAKNDYPHLDEWVARLGGVPETTRAIFEAEKAMAEIDRLHEVIDRLTLAVDIARSDRERLHDRVVYFRNELQRANQFAKAPAVSVEPSVEGAGIPIPAPSETAVEQMEAQREDTLRQLHELANDRSGESAVALNTVILSGITDGDQIPCVIPDTTLGRVPFVAISTDELAALRERSRLAHPSQEA